MVVAYLEALGPDGVKIFLWLAGLDRCWTSARLARHGLLHASACALFDQEEETMRHLLVGCVVSRTTWYDVLSFH